jgi:hypothetical protein
VKAYQRRKTLGETIRNTAIAISIMLILLLGAGVAYVYYTGKNDAAKQAAPAEEQVQQQARPEPLQPDPDGPVGASVVFITSPVKPGENTTLNVHTKPEATCKIVAAYNKVVSTDSGLTDKKADVHGSVNWTWTVDKTAALGKWPIKVTCEYNKKVGYVEGNLEVIK